MAKNAACTHADELASTPLLAAADVVDAALARAIDAEVRERILGWESRVALLAGELRARRLAQRTAVGIGKIRHESSG
jgi:phage baseplate assembly protein W